MERCINCHQSTCNCIHPKDLFGSPYYCQKRKRTRKFASPNSPLNQGELDELQACIEAANDLLRSLGSQSDIENTRQLQLHFLEMRGENVSAHVKCEDNIQQNEDDSSNNSNIEKKPKKTICLCGKITNAGKDFLQINQNGSSVFISYRRLLTIKRDDSEKIIIEEPSLHCANQQLRRKLAFQFGEIVAKNPNFINIFFGSPLFLMLKQYIGKDFKIVTAKGMFIATLMKVDKGTISLINKEGELHFRFEEICYLKAFNLK